MSTNYRVWTASTGLLLAAFVGYGIYSWIRVLQTIPYSSNCITTLVEISQRSAGVRPFFIGALLVGAVTFELARRELARGWRFAYLITVGLAAALLVVPWLVDLLSNTHGR